MELALTKEQRQVAHAAATEETRPVLATVCVRHNKLIAANGYVMAETELEGITPPYESDMLIPAKDLLKAKDMRGINAVLFHNNGEAGKARIIDADGEKVITLVQGNFPDTDHLYPASNHVFRIGLAYDVLSTILKVVGKGNFVKLTFYGDSSPVKFEVPNTQTQGVAMPYAVQWPEIKEVEEQQVPGKPCQDGSIAV